MCGAGESGRFAEVSAAMNCERCEEPLVDGFDRVGGLSLCRRCFTGDVERVLEASGWTLWREFAEYNPPRGGAGTAPSGTMRTIFIARLQWEFEQAPYVGDIQLTSGPLAPA